MRVRAALGTLRCGGCFSNPELLLALSIFIFVIAGLTSLYVSTKDAFDLGSSQIYVQHQRTLIQERISRFARNAVVMQFMDCRPNGSTAGTSIVILPDGPDRVQMFVRNPEVSIPPELIPVNCAAIPEGLLESELFGHERGAFTGAIRARPGRFELAKDGTLFLDEIGDMPLAMQSKILRALQEREFERVGGTRPITADVRVIAATHRDLDVAVTQGTFRQDLFYRLQGVRLRLPALRERIDDLPMLVTHLLERAAQRLWRQPATVSTEALRCLWTYAWPGNIRELQHVLEGAMVLSDGTILPEHLPPAVQRGAQAPSGAEAGAAISGSLDEALEEWERRAILDALQKANGVQARAAKILGISERSLWYRVKKLKIQVRTAEDGIPSA